MDGKRHIDFIARRSCHRGTCPECYEDYATRAGKSIGQRLEGMAESYQRRGIRLGKPKHGVFAPPPWKWPRERVEADRGQTLYDQAVKYLKSWMRDGFYGGVLVVHGERRKHTDGSECEREDCHRKHIWMWSPHVHWVGYGFFHDHLPDADGIERTFFDTTGWIYHRIEEKKGHERDIPSTARYILTHSAHFVDDVGEEEGDGYRLVGAMAMCKGRREVIQTDFATKKCPKCQQDLHAFGLLPDGSPNWEFDQGEIMEKVETVRYIINGKRWRFGSKPKGGGCLPSGARARK